MARFNIAIPITGWQVFDVEAETVEQAMELVAEGEIDTDEFDEIEWNLDQNTWDCEEVK